MKLPHTTHPEPITPWRKSSYSGDTGDCVEVALLSSGRIGIRDSKNPAGPTFEVSMQSWCAFIAQIRNNELT